MRVVVGFRRQSHRPAAQRLKDGPVRSDVASRRLRLMISRQSASLFGRR